MTALRRNSEGWFGAVVRPAAAERGDRCSRRAVCGLLTAPLLSPPAVISTIKLTVNAKL